MALASRLSITWRRRLASPVTTTGAAGSEGDGAVGGLHPGGVDGGGGHGGEVDLFVGQRPLAVEAGQQQEVVDQLAHAVGLGADVAHGGGQVLGPVPGAAVEDLGVAADGGERGPQLVGGVGQEAPEALLGGGPGGEGPLDLAEHGVEGQTRAGPPRCAARRGRPAGTGRPRRWPRPWWPSRRGAAGPAGRSTRPVPPRPTRTATDTSPSTRRRRPRVWFSSVRGTATTTMTPARCRRGDRGSGHALVGAGRRSRCSVTVKRGARSGRRATGSGVGSRPTTARV